MEYVVSWFIDIEADSPEEAARKALTIQRNCASWATVFTVREPSGIEHNVDLDHDDYDQEAE